MPIRSAVTVSLVPEARGGPFVFWNDLATACESVAQLGFDAIELFPPSAAEVDAEELRRLLDRHRLQLAAVGTGAGWVKQRLTLTSSNTSTRKRAVSFVREIIDLAARFNAPAIIGSMQGRYGDTAAEQYADRDSAVAALCDGLGTLADSAAQYGMPILYEPLNRYETNLITNVAGGLDFLDSMQANNVRLLADLFHMNIEEADLASALRSAGPRLGHLHFVDSNRRPAGCGHIDFAPVATALQEIGYDGYASAEALPWPDSQLAAEQTLKSFHQWFV
jgi:sugar phosphate isomerase/epimerase